MIVMVVGDKDGFKYQAVSQQVLYRPGLARVDNDGMTIFLYHPYIVVRECGYWCQCGWCVAGRCYQFHGKGMNVAAQSAMPIEMAKWLESPLGQYVRAWEQRHVDAMVSNAFGYHAIQIGLPHWDLLRANRIPYKAWAHSISAPYGTRAGRLVCAPEQLPFETRSIDLIVMPHTLEWCDEPHQVLREVERVLMPEGRVVITGFNPYSLWGLRESLPGLDLRLPVPVPSQVSPARLKDWFRLLSFELDRGRFGCYVPLCDSRLWLRRWRFMEKAGDRWWPAGGAIYVIAAVKRVSGMRLVGPAWRKGRRRRVRRGAVAPVATQIRETDIHV